MKLRILFSINAVAKFTAFAAKVIPYHLDLWAICITVPTSTPNYMLVPICPNGCHCFVKHKWVCESSVKSHICPHMKWAKWNYFGMKILYVLRKWQFQSIEQSIQFRLALHLQKRLASLAWLILLCFSNIQFAPPKGVFSGCNGGISTDAKSQAWQWLQLKGFSYWSYLYHNHNILQILYIFFAKQILYI